jgi:glycosyltransferase involved in cell wall biosynthesis
VKVLVSAYACEPGRGSEPGAGWAWARAAGTVHDVWLLTRANNAGPVEAALAAEPGLRITPVYVDLPPWARFWKRWPMGVQVYYLCWQVLAWRAARRLHRSVRFDVAWHLTFASDWMPAGVAYVPGPPLVWGPVGGATGTPWRLWRWLGLRGLVAEAAREAVTRALRRLFGDPVARRAAVVVAQNRDTAARFGRPGRRVVVEPNAVIDLDPAALPAPPPAGGRRRAVFAGRLVAWKGAALAVAALARPEAADWSLDVFGDGPQRRRLLRLARRLGVADRVRLWGQRPRAEVLAALAGADALLFPSMHDAAGWAVAEAVALGCPVVCLDRGGPPLLAAGSGAAVPADGDVVGALARALAAVGERGRPRPSTRWSAARLPALVDGWLAAAREQCAGSALEVRDGHH